MNILVICHFGLYKDLSFSFVHSQVKEFVKLGHNVKVIVPIAYGKKSYDGKRFDKIVTEHAKDNVNLCCVRYLSLSNYGKNGFNLNSFLTVLKSNYKKIIGNFAPNIIHSHTLGFDSEIGAWLKDKLNVPLVVTTHGSDTSVPYEKGEYEQIKAKCDKVDAVVAVSNALKDKLDFCKTETQTFSILNGFSVENIAQICDKVPYSFIQVGHLIKQKKVDITIKTFAKIYAKYPEATLTIIGEGADREVLEEMCRELHIEKQVKFLGQISNKKVLEEMEKSRFFCMPSVREGFGIVYLEAMASGCITIGTEGEGIADLIINGENGILVPPNDVEAIVDNVEYYISNPQKADILSENGKTSSKSLTWGGNAKEYVKLFEEINKNDKYTTKRFNR